MITIPVSYTHLDVYKRQDVGYGSGAAVTANVVLTAAHMVFNDNTLSYVNNAWWSFQEQSGVFQPEPEAARGWYVLSGYCLLYTSGRQLERQMRGRISL